MWTLRDSVGEMLAVDAAVLTRLSTFGVFGVFVSQQTPICSKLNCNSIFRHKRNKPFLLDMLKCCSRCLVGFWDFLLQILLRLSKSLFKQKVVENDEWLGNFRVVLRLLFCSFLEFWKEKVSWLTKIILYGTFFECMCSKHLFGLTLNYQIQIHIPFIQQIPLSSQF